jgi:hypothetical protein
MVRKTTGLDLQVPTKMSGAAPNSLGNGFLSRLDLSTFLEKSEVDFRTKVTIQRAVQSVKGLFNP